jgi:hypothetical protein
MRVDEDPRHHPHAEHPTDGPRPGDDVPAPRQPIEDSVEYLRPDSDRAHTEPPGPVATGDTETDTDTDTATDDETALTDVDGGEFPPDGHSTATARTDEAGADEPAVGVAAVPPPAETLSPADAGTPEQVGPTSALYRDEAATDAAREDAVRDEAARDETARDDGEAARDEAAQAAREEVAATDAEPDRPDEADLMAAAATGPDHAGEAERTEAERTEAGTEVERTGAGTEAEREELAPGEVPVAATVVLWEAEVVDGFRDRWQQIQLRFIDDPRRAAEQAQVLAGDVCQGLADALTRHRGELDRWQSAQLDDTEELRVTVRRYRDLLDRLFGF